MNTSQTIEQLHAEIEAAHMRVRKITGLTENELNDMLIDRGIEWLRSVTRDDRRAMEFIPRTREFWGFWKKTWLKVDQAFLAVHDNNPFGRGAATLYDCMHRVSNDNIHLNNASVQAHYHMLRSMITTEKR